MRVRANLVVGAAAALTACSNAAPGEGAGETPLPVAPRLVSGAQAVSESYVPSIDPATMNDAEIARVLPGLRRCAFRYTDESDPVLVTDGTQGIVKINGDLVALTPPRPGDLSVAANGQVLSATGMRLTIHPLPDADPGVANLRFEVAKAPGLRVDYQGFYRCSS